MPTLTEQLGTLTQSVDTLTAAVNVKKAVLDASANAAANSATQSAASANTAANYATFVQSIAPVASIGYSIDGGGGTITTGSLGAGLSIPFNCTINSVTLLADVTGSIVIDIWKDAFASYPPIVADSICGSAKPTLTSSDKMEDTTLTGWTKTITAGDVLRFNVDSASLIRNVTLILKVTKT